MTAGNAAFRLAGCSLLAGGAVHVLALFGGPHWLAVLGAPPSIVSSAERGTGLAPTATLAIVGLLAVLAVYCFASAGTSLRLPLKRTILSIFAAVFILRGLLVVPFVLLGQSRWTTPAGDLYATGSFFIPGSLVVLMIGGLIVFGLATSARRLGRAGKGE